MHYFTRFLPFLGLAVLSFHCQSKNQSTEENPNLEKISQQRIQPLYISDTVSYDSDDPAIWINSQNPKASLILGTDKDMDGALYVFDLQGKKIDSLIRRDIKRPNNVDVGYGLQLASGTVDFAVTGERYTSRIRFFALPSMKEIVPGGLEVYQGESGEDFRDLMGIALYQDPSIGKHYVIAGRKNGPTDGSYLWQYEIKVNGDEIFLELVRKFGNYSGLKEIEAIAVDQELGYIYYSDEGAGVRKYHADPAKGNEELAFFAQEGFADDHEGISIYKLDETTGYILVSDQGADQFHVFAREGAVNDPHRHDLITTLPLSTLSSDGSEVSSMALGPDFPHGLFVAMSDDKTFQIYRWEDLAQTQLKIKK
ncbi:phytase [Algoriphagus namhaensis]